MTIHAYVLMTNHVHLLATGATEAAIPRAVQGLGRRYVAYFNLRHGRTGTLWEGRYKCSPVATDRYVLACHRYIVMNPVRAGIVAAPGDYLWSSHRHYARASADPLVIPHPIWLQLGATDSERREAFLESFDRLTGDELELIRASSRRGLAIGDEVSCKALEGRLGRRVTARGKDWRRGQTRQLADDDTLDLLCE